MLKILVALLLILSLVTSLSIFWRYQKQTKQYGIWILGVYMTLDLLFNRIYLLVDYYGNRIFIKGEFRDFLNAVTSVTEVWVILFLFARFDAKFKNLYIVFAVLVMLITMFDVYDKTQVTNGLIGMSEIRISSLFLRLIIILISFRYFYSYFTQHEIVVFFKEPFSWLVIGWFVSYTATTVIFLYEFEQSSSIVKRIVFVVPYVGAIVSLGCFSRAFWLTKKWVEQKNRMYEI